MRNAKYCVFWPSIRENHNIFRYQQVRIRFNLLVRVSDSPDRNVSFLTAPNSMADITRIGEDKNISFEDLRLILGKITATKIDGKWTIAPIKKAVQKLAAKLEFQIDEFDLNALFAEEGTRPEPRT